jgi:hypothetical protein
MPSLRLFSAHNTSTRPGDCDGDVPSRILKPTLLQSVFDQLGKKMQLQLKDVPIVSTGLGGKRDMFVVSRQLVFCGGVLEM